MKNILVVLCCVLALGAKASDQDYVRGVSLTEIGDHLYDASLNLMAKTEAQQTVDKLYDLGVRQINLSPRALMMDPHASELSPVTPASDRSNERSRYSRLIDYIHSKGMKVGIRPIFFVIGPDGKTPYVEILPNGNKKIWWHGNIQPQDPNKWFESFKNYLDIYLVIAKVKKVSEFTIGAELYSMTVGLEDQWIQYPHGFPGPWLALLHYVKAKLGPQVKIMYDINFTDDKVGQSQVGQFGGELERWRYRLVDLANPTDPNQQIIWKDLVAFWSELDAVGIDLYRSLATRNEKWPEDYSKLVLFLKQSSDRYASQLDNALFEISGVANVHKDIILKEIGYRSVTGGFIDPFTYAESGEVNIVHQAAAYDAIFQSFWKPQWDWFKGIVFWDASVNPQLHGPGDNGFSPIGKDLTQEVIKRNF